MWARVARYEVEPERIDDAVQGFESIAAELGKIEGSKGAYLLVDREDGKTMTITFWEDRQALSTSEVAAARMRREAMAPADGSVQAVEVYEVSVEFGERASLAGEAAGSAN